MIFSYSCLSLLKMFVCLQRDVTLQQPVTLVIHYLCTSQCFHSLQTGVTEQSESSIFSQVYHKFRLFSACSHLMHLKQHSAEVTALLTEIKRLQIRSGRFFGCLQSNCESTTLASVLHSDSSA